VEIWKDIPGYEGAYQASTYGQIRSLTRKITQIGRGGLPFTRTVKGRVLRPAASRKDPHLYVVLGHGAAGSTVHQLVALTFLGPCPNGMEVRHIEGDAKNNSIGNLCYGSRTENILDVFRIGRAWRKLTLDQIKEIHARTQQGAVGARLAELYGVSQTTISAIKLGRYRTCTL